MDNYTNDELLHIRDDFIDFLRKRNYKESTLAVIKSVTATPFCHKSDMLNCQCLI